MDVDEAIPEPSGKHVLVRVGIRVSAHGQGKECFAVTVAMLKPFLVMGTIRPVPWPVPPSRRPQRLHGRYRKMLAARRSAWNASRASHCPLSADVNRTLVQPW
jgi:hypothetical protein